MIEARKNHGLVFVKDKIFAVGGQNGSGTPALVILCMVSQGFMGGFCKEFILLSQLKNFEQYYKTCCAADASLLPSFLLHTSLYLISQSVLLMIIQLNSEMHPYFSLVLQ